MAKVLVVEDDPDSMEVVGKTLERAGHTVIAAFNGWEALLALDAHHVDLIVLDLMMPGMDGSAFLRIIRNDRRRKTLPVIILTALNGGDVFRTISELGVQQWLLKTEYIGLQLNDAVERLCMPPAPRRPSEQWQDVRPSQRN